MDAAELQTALDTVKAAGYVVLKEKSYRQAQERQRVAQVYRECADADAERVREWAHEAFREERRLRERLTFVYGVAQAHGATVEELRGPTDHVCPLETADPGVKARLDRD